MSYITSEYKEKTIKKLKKFKNMYFAALVIEEDEKELYELKMFSGITNEQIINHLASIICHYNVHTYFSSDRFWLELYILHRLVRCYKYLRKTNSDEIIEEKFTEIISKNVRSLRKDIVF